MNHDIFGTLVRKLEGQEPQTNGSRRASVSVILTRRVDPETLLIKRADRAGDPWSGQVAFPGGKAQQGDITARDTAIRETLEEVGVDLRQSSEFLGYFGMFRTHTGTMDVIPSVFLIKDRVSVKPNEEVSSFKWVPLNRLVSPETRGAYKFGAAGNEVEVPALLVDDYTIWGLTHTIISALTA